MSQRSEGDLLNDILHFADLAKLFTTGLSQDEFLEHPMVPHAVIRVLAVIGEATKRLPQDFRDAHPQVPWRRMAAMRDVLVHNYVDTDLKVVWSTVITSLPPAVEDIRIIHAALKSANTPSIETP